MVDRSSHRRRVSPTSLPVKLRSLVYKRFPGAAEREKNKLKGALHSGPFYGSQSYRDAERYSQHFHSKRLGSGNVRDPGKFMVAHRASQSVAGAAKALYRSTSFQRRLLALPPEFQKEVADYARKLVKTGATMHLLNRRLVERHEKTPDVYNARKFKELVNASLSRRGKPFTLVLLDLDFFKSINDTYGHSVGDAVLDLFAHELRRAANDHHGFGGRLGGEEFALGVALSPHEAQGIVDAFRLRFELMTRSPQFALDRGAKPTSDFKGWKQASFTAGIAGFAAVPRGVNYDVLLHASDRVLYAGKKAGRARSKIADME